MLQTTFEDLYVSFRLNTIHRFFGPSDAGLIALFALFELLHNFRDLVNFVNGSDESKQYSFEWYKRQIKGILKGECPLPIHPTVNEYLFKNKIKNKKKILKAAREEFIQILKQTNLLEYFNTVLNTENKEEADNARPD